MKLNKNKKNEKNKKRFVFLSFLPETDAFSTRLRLEVQRPCFLTDLRELRSDNQDVPPAQVQHVRHEAGEVREEQEEQVRQVQQVLQDALHAAARCKVRLLPLKHILIAQRTANVLSCPVQVHTSCSSSEALRQHLPSLRQYIFPVATNSNVRGWFSLMNLSYHSQLHTKQ